MAKQLDIGISNIARKGKKGWIGIDNVARKIKKMWIGVGNVARLFFSGGELKYYGTTTEGMAYSRYKHVGFTIGNYALFTTGYKTSSSSYADEMDAYNESLTHSKHIQTHYGVDCRATNVGKYALFGGGYLDSAVSAVIIACNPSLSFSIPTGLSTASRWQGATSVGDYAMFAGGQTASATLSSVITAYSTTLTRNNVFSLSKGRRNLGASTAGDYAIFAGGNTQSTTSGSIASNVVDTVNTSLTVGSCTELSAGRYDLATATVGKYALFAGGKSSAGGHTTVDVYDASLTRTIASGLSGAVELGHVGGSIGDYAVFTNGQVGYTRPTTVDIYDASLTKTVSSLSKRGTYPATATIGQYLLISGGVDGSVSNIVDVFQLD